MLARAEKLLRQGKLEAAIGEYVRLTSAHPEDWSSANALGDLYLRVGRPDRAVLQFARAGERLVSEGAYGRAAAVYKKVLRINPGDERATRGLALVAAKQHSGPRRGEPQEADGPDGLILAARAAHEQGDSRHACELLIQAADLFQALDRSSDALAAVAEASGIDPASVAYRDRMLRMLLSQGELGQARCVARSAHELTMVADALEANGRSADAADTIAEACLADPDDAALRARGLRQLVACGEVDRARDLARTSADLRVIAGVLHADAALAAPEADVLVLPGSIDASGADANALPAGEPRDPDFVRVEGEADSAVAAGQCELALNRLHEFLAGRPDHVAALLKVIEVSVENGRWDVMRGAQERLTDAYLRAGKAAEARLIAEDLVIRAPWERTSVERLLRALVLCGDPEPEETIASLLCVDAL